MVMECAEHMRNLQMKLNVVSLVSEIQKEGIQHCDEDQNDLNSLCVITSISM